MSIRICAALLAACAAAPAFAEDLVIWEQINRQDLTGTPNTEVIMAHQTIRPGGAIPPHTHNGDEHLVILEGGELTHVSGKVIPFKQGMTAFFPRGQVHAGLTNTGTTDIVMYNVYVVDKDKPLVNPVE